jgi:hypothetical protein
MPPKQPDAEQLAEELAAMKEELLQTQRELDTANRTKEEMPDGAAAFLAAVS